MNIVFLGPPGSGKGTQAKRLAETQSLVHLSTGDAFREAVASGTELGKEIKNYIDSGKLVPDDLVSRVVFDSIKKQGGGSGIILDGYPRTLDQAKALDRFSEENKMAVDFVLFFDVEPAELVRRLTARRQCPVCKEVYNLVTRSPKAPDKCDLDSADLTQRQDDQIEVVQERLNVYTRQTAPILDYYQNRSGFVRINAAQDIDRVFAEVVSAISSQGNLVN